MPITRAQFRSSQQGFTLVELIIGLVVLGLAVVMLAMLFFPQAQRSAEPILQTRAAGLGQALMLEIMSKSFDQHSDRTGGLLRCGETDAPTCTEPTALGPDSGETRALFNDVDDYHGLNSIDAPLSDALGQAIGHRYPNFNYAIDVCYYDVAIKECSPDDITPYKLITITITTPLGQDIGFSAVRGNY